MKRQLTALLTGALLLGACSHADQVSKGEEIAILSSKTDAIQKGHGTKYMPAMIETADEVILYSDGGGYSDLWFNAGKYVVRTGKTFRIMRNCVSACTIMADVIRRDGGKVCLNPSYPYHAFLYHKAKYSATDWRDVTHWYSPEIQEWLNNNGGLPAGYSYTKQEGAELHKFYPLCETAR